jgi:DMSO reductase family type II enzyme molybdopterin subunit
MSRISRREFLQVSAAGALTLGLDRLAWCAPKTPPSAPVTYSDWQDLYRAKWKWDRIVRGTHTNANCVSSCAWNLYVRDGIVWREEQSAPYVASNDQVPDFNPRGCQKGASCSDLMLGPTRVRYPLRRVGPRGAGRWKRISWDEALDEIAGVLVEELAERGGEGVLCELGPNIDYGPHSAAALRFFRQIGAPLTDSMAQIGDLPVGGTITLGTPHTDGTSDDWFRSRYIVLWACNPSASRIPDAHYLNEARYHGAQVVCIAPDYNQSAIHSDLWISPHPGADAALAMSACQIVVEEGLYDADYIREQTDLPLLIRRDNGRFLREADLVPGGADDRFCIWDETADQLHFAPGTQGDPVRSIALPPGVHPALEIQRKAKLANGEEVAVQTVFSLLRTRLDRDHKPEQASKVAGVHANVIRRFAREFAAAESALILSQWGACKHYHSDLLQRAQILLASLTGNLGKAGGGWRSGAFIALDGLGVVAMQDGLGLPSLGWLAARAYFQPEAVRKEFEGMYVPSTILHAVHGGLAEVATAPEHGDPLLPEGARPKLEHALAEGHFPIVPAPGDPSASVIFSFCGNVLRHTRRGERVRDTLFKNARLIVDVNFRMSETGRNSDIILPAAGWYEKIGIKYIAAFVPYVTLGDAASPPLAESKPEWEIFARLAERVATTARERGVDSILGFRGESCSLSDLGDRFTDDGRFPADGAEDVLRLILSVSSATKGVTLEYLRSQGGAVRIRSHGPEGGTAGIYSEFDPNEPIVPLRDFVEKKRPYPTLTGRQQFYIDHPWFLELGEELPTHKDSPAAGGQHPFTLTGAHTRWSIHAMWRDHAMMLRLQRGEPIVMLNDEVAEAHGIEDHGLVRVWNDLGEFEARAKLTGAIRPEQIHIFHAWEPFQFRKGVSHQSLVASPMKVTQLVGDYGHLHWGHAYYEPNQVDRDTRVNIESITEPA